MKNFNSRFWLCAALLLVATSGASSSCASAQKTPEKAAAANQTASEQSNPQTKIAAETKESKTIAVKQIDLPDLQTILKENAAARRPLLVNFWATWCAPCREEFPELVKIDSDFRQKGLEFVTVSLDDLADKDTEVPKFLTQMKAQMPAFLLKTADEEAAIAAIAPEWRGALPLTVLYDQNGKAAYTKMGVIKPDILRQEIEKVLPAIKQ